MWWLCIVCHIRAFRQTMRACEVQTVRLQSKKQKERASRSFCFLVRVFITDLILRHSAEVVETYSQSTENACVYKQFYNAQLI